MRKWCAQVLDRVYKLECSLNDYSRSYILAMWHQNPVASRKRTPLNLIGRDMNRGPHALTVGNKRTAADVALNGYLRHAIMALLVKHHTGIRVV
ncbi:hypothetical protein TNCV_1151511 [Trichonephila clavipes]|nr:hypothetical protein TNCV_1151511 [Trichonephila clavipes]